MYFDRSPEGKSGRWLSAVVRMHNFLDAILACIGATTIVKIVSTTNHRCWSMRANESGPTIQTPSQSHELIPKILINGMLSKPTFCCFLPERPGACKHDRQCPFKTKTKGGVDCHTTRSRLVPQCHSSSQ